MQGGGSHGALAWGVIDRFLEDGRIKFDSISATSAGAMNAAVLAHGLVSGGNEGAREALHQFWRKVSDASQLYNPIKTSPLEAFLGIGIEHSMSYFLFDFINKTLSPYQSNPYNFNPLKDLLSESIDIDRLKSPLAPKLFISATNVKTGKIKVFSNEEMSIDAIMASACLPFIFQAVKIGEDYLWDGGYLGNPAIFPLIYNSNCSDILIIHINPIHRDTIPETSTDILNRVNEISFNSSLMREMRTISFVTKMIDDGWIKDEYRKKMKRCYLHAIRADLTMQSLSVASKMNSDWPFIEKLFNEGRSEGFAWLKQNFRHVGKATTIDLQEYL